MADKRLLDEVDQIDLELNVSFNEFEDESKHANVSTAEHFSELSNQPKNVRVSVENSSKSCLADSKTSELSLEAVEAGLVCSTSKAPINKNAISGEDEEEGELMSQEEEMELLIDTNEEDRADSAFDNSQKVQKSSQLARQELKRKVDDIGCLVGAEANMDIDDSLILESDDDSLSHHEKRCKKEEDCGINDTESTDETMRKKSRGGKRRKKRKQRKFVQYGRISRPIIGRLFRPLIATENDAPEVLAAQLADRLEERKEDLLLQILKTIGNEKGIEIFQETKKIQIEGGMRTVYGDRKRTSGGIFLNILKNRGYATKEQLEEIFAVEREKAKQLIKERKKMDKEVREKGIHDLRQKLTEKKREILLQTENNDLKTANKADVSNSKEQL